MEGWGISSRMRSKTSGLGWPYANHRDLDVRALGAFERLGDLVGGPAVSGFAVDRGDLVAGMNAGAERGRVLIGSDDVDLALAIPVILLLDDHADAVVVAALIFAQAGIGLGIVEVRVRVKDLQHAGDGAVVDGVVGLVRGDGLGVVLLDKRVDVSEGFQAVAKLTLILRGLSANAALEKSAGHGADGEEESDGKEGAAGAGSHRRTKPPDGKCAGRLGADFRSPESESARFGIFAR